jgi:hypothetical protein
MNNLLTISQNGLEPTPATLVFATVAVKPLLVLCDAKRVPFFFFLHTVHQAVAIRADVTWPKVWVSNGRDITRDRFHMTDAKKASDR